jgi:putative SOS response-associated peptidase YedK
MNPFEVFLYQINQKRGTSVPASRGSRPFPSAQLLIALLQKQGMTYHLSLNLKRKDLPSGIAWDKRRKEISRPMQDGFDYEEWPIIRNSYTTGGQKLEMAHWEFIPFWINDAGELEKAREKTTTLNARGETLLSSRMFRHAALNRRCLLLSSGFYEWRHYRGQAYPYFVRVKDKEVFYIAGIWQPWTDRESGERMTTFALVTTKANQLIAQVHNKRKRMPVVLTDELSEEWMQKDLDEKRIRAIATFQYPSEDMEAWTIRKDFREASDPMEYFKYENLPEIRV